jgi:hypothetical protein
VSRGLKGLHPCTRRRCWLADLALCRRLVAAQTAGPLVDRDHLGLTEEHFLNEHPVHLLVDIEAAVGQNGSR